MAARKSTKPAETPPAETTLDEDVTRPATTAPGDGPADTTDPTQIAVSTTPAPGAEAVAVGTVNAVKPAETPPAETTRSTGKDRIEQYVATRPDGTTVTVVHNIDTGETSVK